MFNAYNTQPGYGDGSYQAWQTVPYGNPQGNFGAATGLHSFPVAPNNGYQLQYGAYDVYGHQGAWQTPHPNAYPPNAFPQQHVYAYAQPASDASQPPLPDGAPPPLPPTLAEEPPPLPPDAPEAPPPPPLPPMPGDPQGQPSQPAQQQHPPQHQVLGQQAANGIPGPPGTADAWVQPGYQPPDYPSGTFAHVNGPTSSGWYAQPQQPHSYGQPGMRPYGYPPSYPGYPQQHPADFAAPPHHHPPAPAPAPALQQPTPQAPAPGTASYHSGGAGPGGATTAAPGPVGPGPAGARAGPGAAGPPAAATPPPLAPVVIDITRLLRPPHRATRPRKLLLVLRGLPGSGKSTLAKKIREAEVEAGAEPPRLHSIDDYYMQEVEVEVVEEEGGRKKRRKVTELKYVLEPEMEATYFRDLVRAVGRSCEDRRHSFVVVDAPVLRADQLRELMAVGQRANFECYALRPLETDPEVVASPGRNLHGHSLAELRKMAASWEDAPPLYAQVSAVSLFGGPMVGEESKKATRGSSENGDEDIQEVDMDDESGDEEDEGDGGAVGGGAGGSSRWHDDGDGDRDEEALAAGRRASRWHDDADEGGEGGGRDASRQSQRKRRKKDKAQLKAAAADLDEEAILAGLNDALADPSTGTGQQQKRSASVPAGWGLGNRPGGPLRSALRRVGTAGTVGVEVGAAKRRVWWRDLGQGGEAAGDASSPSPSQAGPGSGGDSKQLVDVVYLEGLGPPQELEDLPYGYQRKAAGGPAGRGGGAAGMAAGDAHGAHHNFRDQAKAEHESEHDLFRRLLFGKQAAGAAGRAPSGGTPLGLFESLGEDDDEGK